MNTRKAIQKILFVTMWIAVGGGMLTLLIAAIGKQKRDVCRDYSITIKGSQKNLFVDEKSIIKIIELPGGGKIKGQKKTSFNLLEIERLLKNNVWIKQAELYFDNHDVLHVSITEREPIARIFTTAGRSFYIDDLGNMMPLSDKLSARVPVFTGFPVKVISGRDSILLNEVSVAASLILHDPFWMSQIAQIDITTERNFEMIPVVGNHLVILGDGENMRQKLHRLYVFYKNVLSQTGFDKYKAVNVQYAGQVIGIKNVSTSKSDTTQLRLNVEKLLRQAREVQNDSLIAAKDIKDQKAIQVDPAIAATEKPTNGEDKQPKAGTITDPVLVTNPVPMKQFSNGKGKPKAVMPKR